MIFQNLIINFFNDPVSILGILIFYFLLVNFPISLIGIFNKKLGSFIRFITILVNLSIAFQLTARWYISGHFPISNLYESLYFLVWGITLGQLLAEKEYQTPIIPAIAIPVELLPINSPYMIAVFINYLLFEYVF